MIRYIMAIASITAPMAAMEIPAAWPAVRLVEELFFEGVCDMAAAD
jgi:hypothetical protein